jgi:hypothetical protein
MSRLSNAVKKMSEYQKLKPDEITTNFMGGDSYKLNPLDTLKMIAASSIFGEPSYYRSNVRDGVYRPHTSIISDLIITDNDRLKTTTEIFTEAIDKALEYDFGGTLDLAISLRHDYYMRLNPQVIMVRAAIHPKRKEWSEKNPGRFNEIQAMVMMRADEPATQLSYYLFINKGKKANIPSILKRSIANKLSGLKPYQVNKYKNAEIGMINAVRLTHANSPVLDELMKTGTVKVPDEDMTWEQKKSAGMSWKEILETTKLGHMALLRNIRNVFTEIDDMEVCEAYMTELKDGVLKGKQFPFRYESAYRVIEESNVNHKPYILDRLEECIDISIENMPKLKGRTMCLSDNSGSAWGAFNSEYGRVTVANIDNLSSVIAAQCSDEGYVGKFGDLLKVFPVSKRNGVLSQARNIDRGQFLDVGSSTEGGIWQFFKNAIENHEVWDNIFIFSDQQAGTGGLYGRMKDLSEYSVLGYGMSSTSRYINVYKLILEYRKKVNPKVNVFSVQTAGYNNVLIPEMSYRCAMLTGWTGKEISFAAEYIKQWDEIESRHKNNNNN